MCPILLPQIMSPCIPTVIFLWIFWFQLCLRLVQERRILTWQNSLLQCWQLRHKTSCFFFHSGSEIPTGFWLKSPFLKSLAILLFVLITVNSPLLHFLVGSKPLLLFMPVTLSWSNSPAPSEATQTKVSNSTF